MGTDLRLDRAEGEGTPISVRSSADPYFFCYGGGKGRTNNIMELYCQDDHRD